jgi:quercetin dioxygenase-like cupin family protein
MPNEIPNRVPITTQSSNRGYHRNDCGGGLQSQIPESINDSSHPPEQNQQQPNNPTTKAKAPTAYQNNHPGHQRNHAANPCRPQTQHPLQTFTGTVHMDPIFTADDGSCMGNNVCFTPGARTFWHTHERGQILTVTMGTGFVCSKGETPRKLMVGDVVHVPAGEMHWHGATGNTIMAHTAISLGSEFVLES